MESASVIYQKITYNMREMTTLNSVGQRLYSHLVHASEMDDSLRRSTARAEKVNVVGAGGALTAAYEQLRNAAENTEEHLLLQNAIRRFYKQLFVARDEQLIRTSGNELAIELTFAGYIANNSLTKSQVAHVSDIASKHYTAFESLHQQRSVSADSATKWILDTLALSVAHVVNPHVYDQAFVEFAYVYLEKIAPKEAVLGKAKQTGDYGAAMFVAIEKALLKSDGATIRAALLTRYAISVDDLDAYVSFNTQIDSLLNSPLVDRLYHIVDRQGAPLRIIRRMIETQPDFVELLPKREAFLDAFEKQITREYSTIMTRVNRAIVRSVIFLIITKFIIGIAVEVPYDLWVRGQIEWQPLLINLLSPPLYMVMLRLTLTAPGYANTSALVERVDSMLYGAGDVLIRKQLSERRYSPVFSALYIIFGLIVFGAVTWLLLMLGFSFVHIAIFFVFISAASFLGFRLSRLIRELEIVRSASNGLTFVRDVIYLPFVVVGRWMSDRYAQVNIVTLILDMLIELPLKTVLRLVRQWGAFIDDRKDKI